VGTPLEQATFPISGHIGTNAPRRVQPRRRRNIFWSEDSNVAEVMQMKDSTKDQIKGKKDELVGKVKSETGKATDDSDLEAEGKGQQLGGKVQKKTGEVEKVFDK
jgi:uncharacterized protein YjbJ (UPF0337 family)